MQNMNYKPDFLMIPYELFEDKTLQPTDLKVYAIIYYFHKMRGQRCIASNDTISELAHIGKGTIKKSLIRLETQKYIQRTYTDSNKKIRNEIIPLISVISKGVVSPDTGGSVRGQGGVVSPDNHIRKRDKEELLNIPINQKKTALQKAAEATRAKHNLPLPGSNEQC